MVLMWQSYALGSVGADALHKIADKAAFVRDAGVDSLIATFYRLFFFFAVSVIVGYSGILGEFTFFVHWIFFILAPIEALASYLYSHLLRHVEVTGLAAAGYLAPFLFFLIDTYFLKVHLSPAQIMGIVMLVLGGIAFSIDGKTHHFVRTTWRTWIVFFFVYIFAFGTEVYAFKYAFEVHGVNGVSFHTTFSLWITLILFVSVLYKRKTHKLFSRATRIYIPYALAAKTFDVFGSILFASAIALASVSQVSAFAALTPFILFVFAAIVQTVFRVRLHENLDHRHTPWKLGAMLVLLVGGLLVA